MTSRVKIWTIVAVSVSVVVSVGVLLALPKQQVDPPMPNPNGWTDLVGAAQLLPQPMPSLEDASLEQLKDYVSASQGALTLMRVGLQKETRAPTVDYFTNTSQRMGELASCKRLALTVVAEGRVAESEDRPGDAAKSYLDAIKLGQQCGHGGLIIHYLVSIACEAIGVGGLERMPATALNAQQCREVVGHLEELDLAREPLETVLSAERRSINKASRAYR